MIYMNSKIDGEWKSLYVPEVVDFDGMQEPAYTSCIKTFCGKPATRFDYAGTDIAVLSWCSRMNGLRKDIKESYFQWKDMLDKASEEENTKIYLAWRKGEYYYVGKMDLDNAMAVQEAPKEEPEAPRKHRELAELTDHLALLGTRRLLRTVGPGEYYDGQEFKFLSNRHPAPANKFIPVLASRYMMGVIIPNALLAREYGYRVTRETAMRALDYCMRTGKKRTSVLYWEAYVASNRHDAQGKLFSFYVEGIKADGTEVEKDRRCFFKKFVDLKQKDATQCRKTKNETKVSELLERMKSEPELKTMSHRQLMALGITNRAARLFMKAREEA